MILRVYFGGEVDSDMDESDLHSLRALQAAGVEGAQDLIDAIERCGRIHVKEEY